jgi:SNF2 family DNA or RNA helicase
MLSEVQKHISNECCKREEIVLNVGMGLGKTRAILNAMDFLMRWEGSVRKVLIVAPKRVSILTWTMEIKKWEEFNWMRVAMLRTEKGMKQWDEGDADVFITNYEQLPKLAARITKTKHVPADLIIWDELTFAKSHSSKRINSFRKHRHYFTRHWGLTGTLLSEGYLDLFAQIRLIDGGKRLGGFYTHYRSRFFESDYMGYKYNLKHGAKERIHTILEDLVVTFSSEEFLEVPEPEYLDVDIQLPSDAAKLYKQMKKEMLIQIKGKDISSVNAAVLIGKLQQLTSGFVYSYDDESQTQRETLVVHTAKVDALKKIIEEAKSPVIVVTNFISERDAIVSQIEGAKLFHEDLIDDWDAGRIPVIVSHPKSFGHGLNLQKSCHTLVWMSLTPSIDITRQTNARIVRTGQKQTCKIYRLMVPESVDWHIAALLSNKLDEDSGFRESLRTLLLQEG